MESGWFYVSFSDEGQNGFLGAVVVEGSNFEAALINAEFRGIHPGGEALGVSIPAESLDNFPPSTRNRLLSREELMRDFEGIRVDSDLTPLDSLPS